MTAASLLDRRRLLVLRHAESRPSGPGEADFDRPLNEHGRRCMPAVGHKLLAENVVVDFILASTARRVAETLDLLLATWQWNGPFQREKQLYLASPETIMQNISAVVEESWQSIMLVGHNPGISQLASHLCGEAIELPTAGLAILDGPDSDWPTALRSTGWKLSAFWQPAATQ